MVKNFIVVLCISALLFSCGKKGKETDVTEEDTVTVLAAVDFEAEAANYVDQEIRLTGTVDKVCMCCAKKIYLKTGGDYKVKVVAGEDLEEFDTLLAGKEVLVTGVVKEKVIDADYIKKIEEECMKVCGAATDEEATEEVAEETEEGGEEVAEKGKKECGHKHKEGKKDCGHKHKEGEKCTHEGDSVCCHVMKINHIKEKLKEAGTDKIIKYYFEASGYEVVTEEVAETEEDHEH